jgi:multiple sugar transport system substrate-binding protein
VGKAYADKSDLNAAINAWLQASATYGQQQGFTVTVK